MSDEGGAGEPLSDRQKREIAVWFLSNAPAGEIHYVAKGKPHVPPAFPPIPMPVYNPARHLTRAPTHAVASRPCADVRALLGDDAVYEAAAAEAFPEYNKARLVSLELPDRSGDVSTSFLSSHPVS